MPATLRVATTPGDVALARALFVEYAQWLAVDLCFQGFAEELATLPGAYAAPRGRLLLAGEPGAAFGCIALRPLAVDERSSAEPGAGPGAGEVKRLFVQPAQRAGGWGRRLVTALVDEARAIGYRELKLDTLAQMAEAQALYRSLGFRDCAPYYRNPLPGVVYLALRLTGG
jgi:ribosomal protein S18 acetylase RimI-like enzyme